MKQRDRVSSPATAECKSPGLQAQNGTVKHFVMWWPFVLSIYVKATTCICSMPASILQKRLSIQDGISSITMQNCLLSRYRRAGIPWTERQFHNGSRAKAKEIASATLSVVCIFCCVESNMHPAGNKTVYDTIRVRKPDLPSNDVLW